MSEGISQKVSGGQEEDVTDRLSSDLEQLQKVDINANEEKKASLQGGEIQDDSTHQEDNKEEHDLRLDTVPVEVYISLNHLIRSNFRVEFIIIREAFV